MNSYIARFPDGRAMWSCSLEMVSYDALMHGGTIFRRPSLAQEQIQKAADKLSSMLYGDNTNDYTNQDWMTAAHAVLDAALEVEVQPVLSPERRWDGSLAGTPADIRVFCTDGEYVVADHRGWLNGVFSSGEEAVAAAVARRDRPIPFEGTRGSD